MSTRLNTLLRKKTITPSTIGYPLIYRTPSASKAHENGSKRRKQEQEAGQIRQEKETMGNCFIRCQFLRLLVGDARGPRPQAADVRRLFSVSFS